MVSPSAFGRTAGAGINVAPSSVAATMETWVLSGAPAAGPDWEPGLTKVREAVESLLGRNLS